MKHLLTFLVVFASFMYYAQVANIATSTGATAFCQCDDISLTSAGSTSGGSPILRTIWSIDTPNGPIADTTIFPQALVIDGCAIGSYSVSIINQHQNGTTSVALVNNLFTVNANPVASINANVNSCQVPFGVTYTPGGGGAGLTANWTFENGTPPTFVGDNPPLISYNTPGDYDVQLILVNTLTGCRDTAFRTMNVSNYEADIILPTGPLCEGEPLQFTDNSTIGANSWSWTFENGNPATSGAQNPIVSFPVGTHDVTLQSGNTSIGCNGFVATTITIVAKPTPSFTVTPLVGCAPINVTFTNTSTLAGSTFEWNFGDGPNFTGANPPIHTYTTGGTYTPTLTMTAANGCSRTISGGPIVLTNPVAAFSQAEVNDCEPKTVNFTDASTAPGAIQTWTMHWGDGTSNTFGTAALGSHVYNCGKYTPSLVIEMANGCRDSVAGSEIKVGTTLNVGFEADTLLQCIKKPIELHSTTIIDCPHEDEDLIYNWSFEGTPETGDSTKLKIFPDTMLNIGYATDVVLEIDFRGCKSSDTIVDYIYIKAPVSKFSLDRTLFCDPADLGTGLNKVVTVNDLQSIYHHSTPITHSLVPPLGSNLETVPDSTMDDVVTLTYKWGDGTPNTVMTDADFEDADKGMTTHAFNDYGSYTVWQIIDQTGPNGTGCIDSTSVTVHVSWLTTEYVFDIERNGVPVPTDSICPGESFEFTSSSGTHGLPNSAVQNPHTPLSYSFNFGLGGTVSGSSAPENQEDKTFTHTLGTPGNYLTTLTTTNSVGCVATHIDQITVLANPTAALSVTPNAGCIGITYTAVATNNSTFGGFNSWATTNAFDWTITPNGGTATNEFTQGPTTAATVDAQITNTTTFSLTVTDGWGCTNSTNATANVQQPIADFIFPTDVCHGEQGLATAIPSGTGPFSYEWFVNTQPDGTPDGTLEQHPYLLTSAGLSQTHTYCLIVQDNLDCPDTICKTVTVSKPVASFTDVKDGSATDEFGNFVCPPLVIDFTNTSQSVNPITNYSWDFDGPFDQFVANPDGIQYLFPGSYDLTLIIQDAVGCSDTLIIEDYVVIEGPSVTPSIVDNGGVCGQDFTFSFTNANLVSTWNWSLGDSTVVLAADEPDNSFIHGYNGVQTYYPVLTVEDNTGCQVRYFDTIVISPNGVNAFFTASPDEINLGTVVNFDESSTSTSNILTWDWNFGDGSTTSNSSAIDESHQYYIGGQVPITLIVTDDRGCTDDHIVYINVDVKFSMPNVFTGFGAGGPNDDLALFADVFNDFEILIVNRWGNVVYEGKRDPLKPKYLWNGIDQGSGKLCNDGTYFYKLNGILKNEEPVNIHGFVTLIASKRP